MAWTAPKTYASGDVLTAANMNATAGRDNELILKTSIDDLGNLSPDIETSSVTSTNQNHLAITVTTGTLVFPGASAIDITGIVAPATAGKLLSIVNRGSGVHTLKDDVTSTAANRFDLGGSDLSLAEGDSVVLVYENSRWRAWCKPPGAAPAVTLLHADSGTSTATSGTNLSTVALSGLTSLDTVYAQIWAQAITQNSGDLILYHATDGVNIYNGSWISSGQLVMQEYRITQAQDDSADIWFGRASSGAGPDVDVTTAWTGSWSLAFRGAVGSGGTLRWKWLVFKEAGQ